MVDRFHMMTCNPEQVVNRAVKIAQPLKADRQSRQDRTGSGNSELKLLGIDETYAKTTES